MQDFQTFEPCAVVVPETVQKCRDVLPASPQLTYATPYPFGVSICTWDASNPYHTIYLPLIYVSEQVARDRAPEKHVLNASGVGAGWYVIAQPGMFEVHVPYLNPEHEELPWEDSWSLELKVDGQDTNIRKIARWGIPVMTGIIWEGFLEERVASDLLSKKPVDKIRQFEFEKITKGVERHCEDSDVGTMCLKVSAGIYQDNSTLVRNFSHHNERKEVSEKAIAKDGRTLQVSNNGAVFTRLAPRFVQILDQRRIPSADIKLFVRERNWLRSRRLIDDDGKPMTYGTYLKMLDQDGKEDDSLVIGQEKKVKKMKVKDEIDLEREEKPVKRTKIKKEFVLTEEKPCIYH